MFVRRSRAFGFWMGLAVAGLLLGSGCQPGGVSGPTGTVSGKVTLAGQPAPAGCTVTFMMDSGALAAGQTGPNGAYELKAKGKPQVAAGKYKVMVSGAPAASMSEEDYTKMMSPGGKAPAQKASVIPAKYASTTTSGLSFEVKTGANTIDIELK